MNSTKKSIVFFLIFAAILLCFSSCASAARARESQLYVWLTNNARFFLLPPEYIETPMDNHQLMSASFGGQNFQLSAWVKADEMGIDMTMVNELGATVGELSYRAGAVSFSSPMVPRSIGGEFIVADFQLAFYCAIALRKALESIGLFFEEAGVNRRVFEGEMLIIDIERRPNAVMIVNHLRGYSLALEGDFK